MHRYKYRSLDQQLEFTNYIAVITMEFSLFSIFPYAVLSISLIITCIVYIKNSSLSTQNKNLPPGSLGLPYIGESLKFISDSRQGKPEKFIYDRMTKFSSQIFKTSLFGEPTVVLCGVAGHKFLFTNENKLVTPWWPSSIDKLFPPSKDELSTNEESKRLRKIFQTVAKSESYGKYVGIMDMIAQRHFASNWEGVSQVLAYPLAKRFTFWLACCLFLSIDEPEEVAKLAGPFDVLASGILSLPVDLPGTSFHRALKASKIIRKQLQDIIKQRKIQLLENNGAPQVVDVLSHMILCEDENGQYMSDENMANKILSLLIGGHDTASATITFVVKYLAEYPHVYDEVFNEHMEILKSKSPGELLNWADIQRMKYSWNVACEVMRLAPPLPGAFRQAIKDFDYAGFSIPKGWKIYWSAHSTHLNAGCFPEPDKFDPSRFDGSVGVAPYTFIPFGGGPRMCPGKEYARLEVLVFIHNIVKRFKWKKMLPNEKIIVNPTPIPANGLPIQLYPHNY